MPRWSHNKLVIAAVQEENPREVYAGLLWWQKNKGYKPGWVAVKFREIKGKWPRPQSTVEPQIPSSELREYLGIMQNRWRQKKKREEAKQVHSPDCACWACVIRLQQSVIESVRPMIDASQCLDEDQTGN